MNIKEFQVCLLCKSGKITSIVLLLRSIRGEKFLLWYTCTCTYVKDLTKATNSYVVENENNPSVLLPSLIASLVLNKTRKLTLFVKSASSLSPTVEHVSSSMVARLLSWDTLLLIYRVHLEECFLIVTFRKVKLRTAVLC